MLSPKVAFIGTILLLSTPISAFGQGGPIRTVTLEEALELARVNNPGYLAARNDSRVADWNVRSAYGSLFPGASASTGISWQGSGEQQFGSLTAEQLGFANQPSFYFSSFNLGLNYTLSGQAIMAPGQAKANRRATEAQIGSAEAALELTVTQTYLDVLRQEEAVRLSEQELERAELNLRLARGQQEVGSSTPIDVRQAEVAVGRAEVTLLQSETALYTANLRLLQNLGLDLNQNLRLSTQFELEEPGWTMEELYDLALDRNPDLRALEASEEAASYGVRMARSSYFPSLSINAGISGFTRQASSTDFLVQQTEFQVAGQKLRCEESNDLFSRLADPLPPSDCSVFQFTDADRRRIEDDNDVFPFSFESNPPSASLSLSLPIFQGFNRQQQLETAKAQREDARYQVREQQLALSADIAAGLASVRAAYQSALIEERNQALAEEQLRLAQERYRLGLDGFIQLVEAETVMAQADRERIAAVFAYHDALASLEAIVGMTLRIQE